MSHVYSDLKSRDLIRNPISEMKEKVLAHRRDTSTRWNLQYLVKGFQKWASTSNFKQTAAIRGLKRKWEGIFSRHYKWSHWVNSPPHVMFRAPLHTSDSEQVLKHQVWWWIVISESFCNVNRHLTLCSFIALDKACLQNFTAAVKLNVPCEIDNLKIEGSLWSVT